MLLSRSMNKVFCVYLTILSTIYVLCILRTDFWSLFSLLFGMFSGLNCVVYFVAYFMCFLPCIGIAEHLIACGE